MPALLIDPPELQNYINSPLRNPKKGGQWAVLLFFGKNAENSLLQSAKFGKIDLALKH